VFRDLPRTEDIRTPRIELIRFAPCRKRPCRCLDRWNLKSVRLSPASRFGREKAVLFFFCIAFMGSAGCGFRKSTPKPSIEFTRVPPAAEGSLDKLDVIEGRIIGGQPGQQLVLYAKSGAWWVQPLTNEAFTRINANWTWTNATHVGTEYAALLVDSGYQPAATLNELPTPGRGVAAVAIAKGGDSSVTRTLFFSGYEWRIRNAPSDRGGINNYDPSNAWTDAGGALHLRIAKVSGEWTCAEVTLTRSLGYGTYSFVVRDTSQLEPAAVFSILTWDYAGTDPNHREMDIEISRWGELTGKNGQYLVQPFYVPENTSRFTEPVGTLVHSFHWEPGRVSFSTARTAEAGGKTRLVAEHVFTTGVPTPGVASVRLNLYVFRSAKQALQNGTEVVIDKFEFLP